MSGDRSDEEELEMLERILTTEPATEFREFVCDELPLDPGDAVLSAGCGPGYDTAALADRVGANGTVVGVDVNGAVLAAARDRCADRPGVSFARGDLVDLPVPDETFDLAVAKQVLQFVDDVDDALRELYRVVRPGGRVAVAHGVGGTNAMYEPTERVSRANDLYFSGNGGEDLGTELVALLPEAGFTVEDVHSFAKVHTEIDDQIERGIAVQRSSLESSDEFADAEVAAWEQDLRAADEADRFLYCGTMLLYVARKPA